MRWLRLDHRRIRQVQRRADVPDGRIIRAVHLGHHAARPIVRIGERLVEIIDQRVLRSRFSQYLQPLVGVARLEDRLDIGLHRRPGRPIALPLHVLRPSQGFAKRTPVARLHVAGRDETAIARAPDAAVHVWLAARRYGQYAGGSPHQHAE